MNIQFVWTFLSKNFFSALSEESYYKFYFYLTHLRLGFWPYNPNIKEPKTFNEKINYIKLFHRPKNGPMVADKVLVREYIEQKIGSKYLIPILGVYNNASEIDFDNLPLGFALKTNHGSGWNIICKDKSKLDIEASKIKLDNWLKLNSYDINREWQYKFIKPLLICEELLEYEIFDFKFFCFNGNPQFIQIDVDRFTNHTRSFYDIEWNKQVFGINYPISEKDIPKPTQLNEMIELAKVLSKGFDFLRVDLYIYNNRVYFGELTLHPGGGYEPFLNKEQDLFLGSFLNLNN
jgi:hypothetical protein